MAIQERNCTRSTTTLEHGLQAMLDLLTTYLGNAATRGEWLVELQRRFTGRDGKLRRGWSDDSIDRKIKKLEEMGLITGGRGRDLYYSAVATAQPRTEQARPTSQLLGFADGADDPTPAAIRKSPANESFLDALMAAKLQLLNRGGKPPAT